MDWGEKVRGLALRAARVALRADLRSSLARRPTSATSPHADFVAGKRSNPSFWNELAMLMGVAKGRPPANSKLNLSRHTLGAWAGGI